MPTHFQQTVSVQPAPVPTPAPPHWTAYVSSLAIPFVAAVAAVIAYRQFRIAERQRDISDKQSEIALQQATTARNKLKLELFEKRMIVYEAARKAIGTAATKGALTGQDQIDYLVGVNSAKWLFDSEVFTYLDKDLWHKIVELELQETMSKSMVDTERVHHILEKSKTLQWLVDQYKTLDDLCAPYLKLEH